MCRSGLCIHQPHFLLFIFPASSFSSSSSTSSAASSPSSSSSPPPLSSALFQRLVDKIPSFFLSTPFVCSSKGFKPLAGAPFWPPEPDRLTWGKRRCRRQAPRVIPGDETTSLNTAECSGCSGNGLPRLIPAAPSLTTCPT